MGQTIDEQYRSMLSILDDLGCDYEWCGVGGYEKLILTDRATHSVSQPLFVSGVESLLDFLAKSNKLKAIRLQDLEQRISTLETMLFESGATCGEETEYEHYLQLFREKKPEFEAAGIVFVIDEENRRVCYRNSRKNKPPIYYSISQHGYHKAIAALSALNKYRDKKAKKQKK